MDTLKAQVGRWLRDKKRSYADGVALFREAAAPQIKAKYLAFFQEVDTPPVSDMHFTMLINKLSALAAWIPETTAVAPPEYTDSAQPVRDARREKKVAGKAIPVAPDLIVKATQDPERVDISTLSDVQKKAMERIKELVPRMANLHTKMKAESLTPEQRSDIARELESLDDERIALWNVVDNQDTESDMPAKAAENIDMSVREQAIIALRTQAGRLKWNISRAERSAKESKSPAVRAKASDRVVDYQKQLDDILAKLNAYGVTSD